MSFADWVKSGAGTSDLDAAIKYAGNSSLCHRITSVGGTRIATHNTFSETQVQIILWVRQNVKHHTVHAYVALSSYGTLECTVATTDTWEKWRQSFWYDSVNDIKWGRCEKWIAGEWTQQGTDTNFGADAPSAGALSLRWTSGVGTNYAWFDELEIYS